VGFRPNRILAGDIGATHSRLAVFRHQNNRYEILRSATYSSPKHRSLTEVLASFLENEQAEFDAVCLGLPVPIHSQVVFPFTNLPWRVDRKEVLRAVGTDRVALINDVQASAAGIHRLSDADLVCLQPGQVDPAGNRVVVSVGTGLGVSALSPSGHAFATEAGHATFAPSCAFDLDLQARLQHEYGHVSWERVASGLALPAIHALLAPEQSPLLEASEIVRRSSSDLVCIEAVETFRRYIGSAVGNIALTLMASGGLYLTGGVAAKVLDKNNADSFISAFRDKGRMRDLLERMPVFLVIENNLALHGAAETAITLLSDKPDDC